MDFHWQWYPWVECYTHRQEFPVGSLVRRVLRVQVGRFGCTLEWTSGVPWHD